MKRRKTVPTWLESAVVMLAFVLALAGCEQKPFSLNGAWTLKHASYPSGAEDHYPVRNHTYLSLFTSDSCYYVCKWTETASGVALSPEIKGKLHHLQTDHKEMIFVEDGMLLCVKVLNDSTIRTQWNGGTYIWVLNRAIGQKQMKEISTALDDEGGRFIFSKEESGLKTLNHVMAFLIAGAALLLGLVGYYARRTYSRKKHLEKQLNKLNEERACRLKYGAEAQKSAEDDFLQSDYYLALCRRISEGQVLGKDEWKEMANAVDGVYAGFSNKLFGLLRMSETEYHVCLLIKLRVPPKDMADVLCKEANTVSSIRSRLYRKVFDRKCGAKEWDDFILSL
jgi:DNA-binding CsgD family transcriptional regulator